MRSVQRARLLLLLTLVLSPALAAGAERPLPLKRFPESRAADKDGFYAMPTAVGDDYFDGTDPPARVRRHLEVARAVGAKYLRCAFSWNGIEKEQGKYDWKFWDDLVAAAEKAGIGLIPYVAYTPEWAADQEQDFWKRPPRNPEWFANFMYQIARRYRGRIRSWELWNEPDLPEYWQGTPEQFVELVQLGAAAVRRADPNAVIVLGGFSRAHSDFAVKVLRDLKVTRFVDVVATHGYPESWLPERIEPLYVKGLQDLAALVEGSGVDLWLNEAGYADYRYRPNQASKWGVDVFYRHEHTPRYAAVMLMKTFLLALASEHISLTGWYRIDDFPHSEKRLGDDRVHFHLGLTDIRGRPKPAYFALRTFNRLFGKPTRVNRMAQHFVPQRSQSVLLLFEQEDGVMLLAGWLRSSEPHEVRGRTGMLDDRRSESVSVNLPCTEVADVRGYDVTGEARNPRAVFGRGGVRDLRLTGTDIFLARFRCLRD